MKKITLEYYNDPNISLVEKINTLSVAHKTGAVNVPEKIINNIPAPVSMGMFGNVWVRIQHYITAGALHDGHKHDHDHMSLVIGGRVMVSVEGKEDKEYQAPAFIEIPAHKNHKIIALEDNTTIYCIFAFNEDGV